MVKGKIILLKYLFLFVVLFILGNPIISQNFDFLDIPFIRNGKALDYPNTGGLKNPMFSNLDIDGDGKKDLFVFDREGEVILPFIYVGVTDELQFRYDPTYIPDFPKLRVFALLVDFNKDGIEDIFTGGYFPNTIEVYRGKRVDGRLQYSLVTFGFNGSLGNFLQIFVGGYTQVYVSNIDIPAIIDVDNDGDIDIVNFQSDSDKLTYYQNMSVEQNLGIDSLSFRINTTCWGGFQEDGFSSDIFLSTGIDDCYNFKGPTKGESRHSGSTSLLLDVDGDGDKDLLLGDLTNERIKLLINHGNPQKAWINEVDHTFPSYDQAARLQVFLAAYHVDVNNDGKRDLIITPNDRNDSERSHHIWLYLNRGSDQSPVFNFSTNSFLIENTISMGSGSHPCFVDYDSDGLTDLILGGNGIIQHDGTKKTWIEYYKNTGSVSAPEFTLVQDDLLGFYDLAQTVIRLAPNAGDLDGDGDFDMLVGEFNGWLFYFENTGGANNEPVFNTRIYEYDSLFVGQNAKPFMVDINGDGLTDIVIGKLNNDLNYFQNQGSIGDPIFSKFSTTLPNRRNLGNFQQPGQYFFESGAPVYINSKEGRLFGFGSQGGGVRLYEAGSTDPSASYILQEPLLGNIYTGTRSVPSFADIDHDGFFELVLGNERGGISFYNTTIQTDKVSVVENEGHEASIFFPNPASELIYVKGKLPENVSLWNSMGVKVNISFSENEIHVNHLPAGMYFIHYEHNNRQKIEKIWIHR